MQEVQARAYPTCSFLISVSFILKSKATTTNWKKNSEIVGESEGSLCGWHPWDKGERKGEAVCLTPSACLVRKGEGGGSGETGAAGDSKPRSRAEKQRRASKEPSLSKAVVK